MLKPFYQGKLDTFCAIYAVLNALRLIFGIRALKARDILNTVLLSLCARPAAFQAVLTMKTDYIDLVDNMLEVQRHMYPLDVIQPWKAGGKTPTVDEFWDVAGNWLAGQKETSRGKAIVFRFLRFMKPDSPPLNLHWTTADYLDGEILHLFDCSHEAEAILNIRKNSFATRLKDVDKERLLYIQPDSARFLRLKV